VGVLGGSSKLLKLFENDRKNGCPWRTKFNSMSIILKEQISTIIYKEAPTFGDKTIALRRPFLKSI
jgi:hypothetical protein